MSFDGYRTIDVTVKHADVQGQRRSISNYKVFSRNILHKTTIVPAGRALREKLIEEGALTPCH
jgi:hypothetical protein